MCSSHAPCVLAGEASAALELPLCVQGRGVGGNTLGHLSRLGHGHGARVQLSQGNMHVYARVFLNISDVEASRGAQQRRCAVHPTSPTLKQSITELAILAR